MNGTTGIGFGIHRKGPLHVSMYYYLCVVKRMYMFEPTTDAPVILPSAAKIAMLATSVLATSVLATLGF